ncbi:MAG: hypothetical protein ACRDUV_06910, partial [Pseudonocardiaceae bacterium]
MTTRPGQHRRIVSLIADADAAPGPAGDGSNGPGPRPLDPTEPRPQFVRDLRAQLITQATTTGSTRQTATGTVIPIRPNTPAHQPHQTRPPSVRRRGYHLGAAAAALVIGLGSLTLLPHHGPPDQLSPAGRGGDTTQAAPDHNPTPPNAEVGAGAHPVDSGDHIARARRHLHHAQVLVTNHDTGDTAQLSQALRGFTRQAERGANALLEASPTARAPESVDQVRAFTRTSTTTLHRLAAALPPSAEDAHRTATTTLTTLTTQATTTLTRKAPQQASGDRHSAKKPTAAHETARHPRHARARAVARRVLNHPRALPPRMARVLPHRGTTRP